MADDILGKAWRARRAVMELCQAVERQDQRAASQGPSAGDQIAVRDHLIAELMRALGDICCAPAIDEDVLVELIAKGRHVLDNVRDALPKAGE